MERVWRVWRELRVQFVEPLYTCLYSSLRYTLIYTLHSSCDGSFCFSVGIVETVILTVQVAGIQLRSPILIDEYCGITFTKYFIYVDKKIHIKLSAAVLRVEQTWLLFIYLFIL